MAKPLINASLVDSFHDSEKIQDSIHNLYRYPARFPPRFISNVIKTFSKPGDFILDPFLGSGTTAVVARKSDRNCCRIEINKEYCCWALKRLEMDATEPTIQRCEDGVFWERNSLSERSVRKARSSKQQRFSI